MKISSSFFGFIRIIWLTLLLVSFNLNREKFIL